RTLCLAVWLADVFERNGLELWDGKFEWALDGHGGTPQLVLVDSMKLASGVDMTGNPLLLLTCLSAMLGVQFFFMGMLGEMCSRIFFEVRGMPNYAIRRTWNVEAPAALPLSAGDRRAAAALPLSAGDRRAA
ncbi:MAG TPA: hypothetical protein VL132_18610, partial [Planctomycetaceae bacterium]|nr:hypothetical protein [Planctomycetaceae bacterium]